MTQGSLQTTGQWSDIGHPRRRLLHGRHRPRRRRPRRRPPRPVHARRQLHGRQGRLPVDQHGQYVLGLQAPPPPQPPPEPFSTTLGAMKIPARRAERLDRPERRHPRTPAARPRSPAAPLAKFPNPAGLTRVGEQPRGLAELRHLRPDRPDRRDGRRQRLWGGATPGPRLDPVGHARDVERRPGPRVHPHDHAQRGFQANTSVITTSDEMLQELVNLKRCRCSARSDRALDSRRRVWRREYRPPVAERARRHRGAAPPSGCPRPPRQAGGERRHDQAPPRPRAQGDLGQRRPDRDRRGDARHRPHAHRPTAGCSSPRRRRRSSPSSSSTGGCRKLALTF